MSFNGWMLPDSERNRVLETFPARFAMPKATHVTHAIDDTEIPQDALVEIVGYATDGVGVEALVVAVNDNIRRPDGLVYHLTLSLEEGRAAKESNEVIAEHGWTKVEPMPIRTRAFMSKGGSYVTTLLSGRDASA